MNRSEWEQQSTDQVEETKLSVLDHQIRLHGIWKAENEGCPHLVGVQDSVSLCDDRKMTPCIYEVHQEPGEFCETFRNILTEWEEELKEMESGKD